jgi:Uma2 family endonuclease
VIASLSAHVRARRLGAVYATDTGFLLAPHTVRAPDAAFVDRQRLEPARRLRGYRQGAPDLAVEVISPSDLYTDVEDKVAEWLAHGARMVIVLNPRRRTAAVHRPGAAVRVLTADQSLDGEDVVPGWSAPLAELFEDDPAG